MDAFSLLLSIVGLVLAVVLIVAQCQLFAIKKYLNDLLQMELALHGVIEQAHITTVVIGPGGRMKLQPLEVTVVEAKVTGSAGVSPRL